MILEIFTVLKNKRIVTLLFFFFFYKSYSQNLLPNFGFEKDNKSIENDMEFGKTVITCKCKNVVDSCTIFDGIYYNLNRAKKCDFKYYYNGIIGNMYFTPYRGYSCICLNFSSNSSSRIVFRLKEPIKKDSIYNLTFYVKSYFLDSIFISDINFSYLENLQSLENGVKNNYLALNKYSVKNERTWVKISGDFKASNDANFFLLLMSDYKRKQIKCGKDLCIDNVSLYKSQNTSELAQFKIEPLKPLKVYLSVFKNKDTTFQTQKIEELIAELKKNKDYLIHVEYSKTKLGLIRKNIVEKIIKKLGYDEYRLTFIENKVLSENINILLF